MTTRKIIWTLTTKEPKINHAAAACSGFNLKLSQYLTIFNLKDVAVYIKYSWGIHYLTSMNIGLLYHITWIIYMTKK